MHADEVETDADLVRRLLSEQFPRWATLPIAIVDSYGTDHDIYRLGGDLVARLPRIGRATKQAAKEREWLPKLAPHVPLALPVQRVTGQPGAGYPFEWSIYEWLPGTDANGAIADLDRAATDLAAFISALRQVDTAGGPARPTGARGGPLIEGDAQVRRSIEQLGDQIDGAMMTRLWEESLAARPWSSPGTWVHGDLLPGNLLVVDGRLSAVIDFGGLNVGDPACDLQPAWNVFSASSRSRFRQALDADDDSWLRGRGWVLYQAISAVAYYRDTNPGIVRQAENALAQIVGEAGGRAPERESRLPNSPTGRQR